MTATPETKFICDRCGEHTYVVLQNVPVHARSAGPEGWLTVTIGSEPNTPPSHFCPQCATGLQAYLTVTT